MKSIKIALLALLIYLCTFILSGCWNYREIDKLAIVSGLAIDKGKDGQVILTVEIVNMQQGQKQSIIKPVYMQAVGDTIFEAARAMIALQGKKLYWSHAKLVIISEDLAKEGLSPVVDFINRDPEIRTDMWILISREKTASDIFNTKPETESILSFQIDDAMRAQKSISKYPSIELYELIDKLESEKVCVVVPTIKLIEVYGKTTAYITSTAIFKKDKLFGYLDEYETKSMLWLQNRLKGGLYVVSDTGEKNTRVSLEILKSKTKIKPEIKDDKLNINVDIIVDVDIGEIMGSYDFISEKGRIILKNTAEKQIKRDLNNLIEKAQKEYNTDFLGFGEKVSRKMPKVWKSIGKQWNEFFIDIDTSINVNVRIKGSATTRKPIKVGL